MMPLLNSKHDVVMQMAALGRTSYAEISQQHYFNTVVSSLHMLKQSYSAVGLKQYNSVGSTDSDPTIIWDRGDPTIIWDRGDPTIIWDRGSTWVMSTLSCQFFFVSTRGKLKR